SITESLDDLLQTGARPTGTLRLLVQRSALAHVIEPAVPLFRREYPDVKLEIVIESEHTGLMDALGCRRTSRDTNASAIAGRRSATSIAGNSSATASRSSSILRDRSSSTIPP